MKNGILTVTILIGILLIGAIGYFAFSSMNNSKTGTGNLNTGASGNNNAVGSVNNGNLNDNSGQTGGSVQPKTYEIKISNFAFSPSTITIKKGDTIKWTNLDSVRHTVTSDSGNELNSNLLSNGESYSNTFSQTGTFNYHCTPHPSMKARVIVE